ncbi:hypothetical protein MRB53_028749 [Persea americana]|uniref:Uncharacterized protein n=1 Tax=Persea americana TaxID=3435 RepID=A0ACC2KGE3_PERAE|nr:hypothetical protein MRB53_028749 [Persea americana]
MTQEARAKNLNSKISALRENLKRFFANTDAIHSDIVLQRDLAVYLTYWLGEAGSGRHYFLTNAERSWLFNIRVGTMVYGRHLLVDIKLYVPSRFAMQLGFSQGVVGAPSSKVKRFGGLQDGRNAWAFYSGEDTTAMISYSELPTFQTAGFTKWFVESLSV